MEQTPGSYNGSWILANFLPILQDANRVPTIKIDTMESFWTAETLKYLWLLFAETEELPFKEWVLNTEAHPFMRPDAASSSS